MEHRNPCYQKLNISLCVATSLYFDIFKFELGMHVTSRWLHKRHRPYLCRALFDNSVFRYTRANDGACKASCFDMKVLLAVLLILPDCDFGPIVW